MPQTNTISTDIGRQQFGRLAIGDSGLGTLNSFEIALGQSFTSLAGTDISETTTTSFTEISGSGNYSRKVLTPGTDFNITLVSGIVSMVVDSKQFLADGAALDDFDQVLLIADIGGVDYVWIQWPCTQVFSLAAGDTYETGTCEFILPNRNS